MQKDVVNLFSQCEAQELEPSDQQRAHLNLLKAMLRRAIEDALSLATTTTFVEVKEARDWFYSDSREAWSYIWLCEHIDLDPKDLLARMIELGMTNRAGSFKRPRRSSVTILSLATASCRDSRPRLPSMRGRHHESYCAEDAA